MRPQDSGFRNPSTGGFQGSHQTHMGPGATVTACNGCHHASSGYNSAHRDGKIKLSARMNASSPSVFTTYTTTTIGKFRAHTSAWKQTPSPILGSCNNVNCHFEKTTPPWSSSAAATDCTTCHGAAPSDGKHPGIAGRDKHGDFLGTDLNSCSYCHVDHNLEPNKFAHATSAGKRSLIVKFSKYTNASGTYTGGTTSYPAYLPSQSPARNGACSNYCHSDAAGGLPNIALTWSDTRQSKCFSCHGGTSADNTIANCTERGGTWNIVKNPDTGALDVGVCFPYLNMSTNGHDRLVGSRWIRKYACANCHADTVTGLQDGLGHIKDGALISANHLNGKKDIKMPDFWAIPGKPFPSYSSATKTCYNVYCHSDGTNDALTDVKPFAWDEDKAECNACHGHPNGECDSCHYVHTDGEGKTWSYIPNWAPGEEWKAAIPMFRNEGPGKPRANSHPKHTQKDFTCNKCHAETTKGGQCVDCHDDLAALGGMTELAHINADKHVNKSKDVKFLAPGATYNSDNNEKTCSGTGVGCHAGMADPQWGGSSSGVSSACMDCHGNSSAPDTDNFTYHADGSNTAKISLQEWYSTGHGRLAAKGAYKSGNPAANFTANACWYCHDSSVMHNMSSVNPFRLRQHQQFKNRFDKECSYCHMEGTDAECLRCHNNTGSIAPQLAAIFYSETARWPDGTLVPRPSHSGLTTCFGAVEAENCHFIDRNDTKKDLKIHNEGSGFWTKEQNDDVKNQYVQMGVCLQCHDDNSNGKCGQCHAEGGIYALGFSVDGVTIIPDKARATSAHFGYKHYKTFMNTSGWSKDVNNKVKGIWKGGKFCWDCHDPHGDKNIFMVHDQVATTTEGKFGIPKTRSPVVFSKKETGADYITKSPGVLFNGVVSYIGICNVCHSSDSDHYRNNGSDSHNQTRVCTVCHEHRFSDSHASGQSCNTAECHRAKPVPRHSGFGLPRDCTKCHAGPILGRMDVMTQFGANSHHVQGVLISNKHCYECHWESTKTGIIDLQYHTGFHYKNYSTVPDDVVDLVIYGANGKRPTFYSTTSAITFRAKNVGTSKEREEAGKVTNHCISCHSDQNNDATPFNDCKTPRQYAWDGQSIDARYSQMGTTTWGKYNSNTYPNANKKDIVTKAFSAHGNAKGNLGGWDDTTGLEGAIPNTRNGSKNVQCYDCHSSHGSKVIGTTTSYVTFNGTKNGGNLKETQSGKGGYSMTYKASQNAIPGSVNPYAAGAGQCFDCHMNQNAGSHMPDPPTPWGFATFSAAKPIKGYKDGYKFASRTVAGYGGISPMKNSKSIVGGHLKSQSMLNYSTSATKKINGLCTPCHDPHGVSPTLGNKQIYAVPLLKGTWMTSPYKEDRPPPIPNTLPNLGGYTDKAWGSYRGGCGIGITVNFAHNSPNEAAGEPLTYIFLDRNTFGVGTSIKEDDQTFAGLCLNCHRKETLSDGIYQNSLFRTSDRIHETVKGWGKNSEHAFTCSKCHQPHNSALPKLMQTDCLDYKRRGGQDNGTGKAWKADDQYGSVHTNRDQHRGYPAGNILGRYSEALTACHANTPGNSGSWPDNQLWNNKTRWQ